MVTKDEESLRIIVGFNRKYTPNDLIDLEEAKKFIESTTDFKLTNSDSSYRIDFYNESEKEELLVHSDGKISLEKVVDNAKTEIPELIKEGYEMVVGLKELGFVYKKELSLLIRKEENASEIYNNLEPELNKTIGEIFGEDIKTTYRDYGHLFRVDYSPSDTF
ncbi:MAG: hypothetical protein KAT28_04740 [Candidatus Aenigmarchaeota archaeon]|nr:hypothetical protein [Candidatus Aenigmarchaeota archaeon]